ncbi:hypothetical protein NQ176_g853 [Zarea fungicola]|uniref:Uncharacterized protein n=1 Tax=Zarea fungicola TaxID=93591 RepID=A0ACC1NWH4_9HYPO|nr:hypothetical protein NQ176_g853 [Lecanicillium fungicola]
MKTFIILLSCVAAGFTAPSRAVVAPTAKSVHIIANVTNPNLNRDSCGATKFGKKAFWTCRDTQYMMSNGQWSFPFTNSVGWSDFNPDGSPKLQHGGIVGPGSTGSNDILLMRGPNPSLPNFFKAGPDMCPDSGVCSDGSRWVGWPDTPPLITHTASDGTITAYSWVSKTNIKGLSVVNEEPPTTLYKLTYKPNDDPSIVPAVTVVNYEFWARHEIGYGTYGNMIRNGYIYAYGKSNGYFGIALARVAVADVEHKDKYEFYVGGKWTKQIPTFSDDAAKVPNAGYGGQGTFYWSDKYQSYIWVGQAGISVAADFYITIAPAPEGPWITPYLLYQGPNGNNPISSYSLQAHPSMLRQQDDGIYVTWTQQSEVYVTPLAYISFK